MRNVTLAALAAVALATGRPVVGIAAPPQPGSAPGPDAPASAAKRGVYGAPIQPAIVGHRHAKTAHHKVAPASKSSANHKSKRKGKQP